MAACNLLAAIVTIIVKHLSTQVPVELIVASDFFIPGLIIFLLANKPVEKLWPTITASTRWFMLVPIFCIIGYQLKMTAFSMGGELVIISTLQQTGLVFVLGIEYFHLKLVPNIKKRIYAGGLCTIGAVLATAF